MGEEAMTKTQQDKVRTVKCSACFGKGWYYIPSRRGKPPIVAECRKCRGVGRTKVLKDWKDEEWRDERNG
jgi:DnaJ-class molecular chaperone